ncbi:MAG: LuxR C-terminal-related transcriptional regulator [Sandaracinaceae bacterium]|nr:LuxR C-terminal-related transcriptional regulator [Sandaracinaceae bacterium]
MLLSPREREVFERLARGETQREVAESLGLSVKTVETYRARIADKLGLKTRADLVRFALESGVLRAGG